MSDFLAQYRGVCCFAEVRHGKLVPTIFELLTIGRHIADEIGEPLSAVLLGESVSSYAESLIEAGADRVYVIEHPMFSHFIDELYANALTAFVHQEKPGKLFLPASTIGRSLAGRIAVSLHTGSAADVTEIATSAGKNGSQKKLLYATRPCFGGNLQAVIVCENHHPEILTIRPMVYPKAEKIIGKKGEVIPIPLDPSQWQIRTKFIEFSPEQSSELDIATAEKIVSGGRGLGKADGFEVIRELAKALHAAVGASRAAVDSGWIPYRHQVGLTGRTVRPKLYVACGISGQVQHLAGMGQSEVIVAINKDPECPLMRLATFSIEADLYEFIPLLIEEIQKQRN